MADPELNLNLYDEVVEPGTTNGKAEVDPLVCPDCGKKMGSSAGLSVHRKWKHREEPKKKSDDAEKPPAERKPKAKAPARVSLAELGSGAWRGLSWFSARAEKMAASRMFQLQADAAGPALDKALKGTMVDRALQPLARMGESGRDAATLVGGPITAQAFVDNPNAFTQAAFVSTLEASLPQIVRSFKEAKKKQERMEADLVGLAEVFGKAPGARVTIQEVALWVLTGSTEGAPPEAAEPAPEEAVA